MSKWISDLLIFSAGIAGGMLISHLPPYFTSTKKKRAQLADIKEKHDEEILNQALRTTEAIRGELDKSLEALRKALDATLVTVGNGAQTHHGKPGAQLSEPVKTDESLSANGVIAEKIDNVSEERRQ